ncbi:MAG: ABC transporter permease [Cyanobacteria bacterium REEB459]|nr:ABC transporter permease [Cyanobacteria bacterium REEB459]
MAPPSPPLITTYQSESAMHRPLQLWRSMGHDLLASRELAWRLMVRDLSAQYRQSLLGVVWAFIPPVLTALGLIIAKNSGVVNIGTTDLPYPVYVVFSVALWQTFVEALTGPLAAVIQAKPLLARVNFPREALILAKLGEVFVNFGIKLILIIGLFLGFQVGVSGSVVLAAVALVHLILLGTALGMWLAPLGMLYEDVSRGLTLAIAPWLLITPVLYPVPTQGWFSWVVKLNPVTPLLVTTRELATHGVVSNPTGFWLASLFTLVMLLLAWLLYRLAMPFLIERISA